MKSAPRILVAPLDWGLGHATRCIPVIRELQRQGAVPVIGADGGGLALLRDEFPNLEAHPFPGYHITYPKNGNLVAHFLPKLPGMMAQVKREHKLLNDWIDQHQLDGVISDNRYGLWSDRIPSVFITHQLFIRLPMASQLLRPVNRKLIQKFDACWVPDYPDEPSLSGELSHGKTWEGIEYIGPLSRLSIPKSSSGPGWDVVVLLSGPEPSRTALEEQLRTAFATTEKRVLLVRGLAKDGSAEIPDPKPGLAEVAHLNADRLGQVLGVCQLVISRSGYSTLMDLVAVQKPAIFIPTPGQTEQEYLADLHHQRGHFYSERQDNFHLERALGNRSTFTPPSYPNSSGLLQGEIARLLERIHKKAPYHPE